jgi:hypothetical protein
MLAFKKKIVKYINPLNTESSVVFWFKISKELLGLDEDVIFGIVYIPPKYTVYSSIDAFSTGMFNSSNIFTLFTSNNSGKSILHKFSSINIKSGSFAVVPLKSPLRTIYL